MRQFRPLPSFDEIEEAEPFEALPVDIQPVAITDALAPVSPNTSGRVPVLLLRGAYSTPVTDQLAALAKKTPATGMHPTLPSVLETTMGMTRTTTSRLVVIPVGVKRKKVAAGKPALRLKRRVRHTFVLLVTAGILLITLLTLVPLSEGQDGNSLLTDLGNWIHSAQMDAQIQAQMSAEGFNLNSANLPFVHIPNSVYVPIAEQDALSADIPAIYFVRQINQESGFNPNAVSVTDAEGIAQFEPYTASGLGINPWNPVQALNGAARLMGSYYHQYSNYAKALGAYNAGPGAVRGAVNACGVNWLSCMPAQTQNYVYVIMGI
jgi:Transglycosylase SLT domain